MAEVCVINTPRVLHNAGEEIQLDQKPVLMEAPGHVGLLVIPLQTRAGIIEPSLKPIEIWPGNTLEKTLNIRLNELTKEINKVQNLFSQRKEAEAFERVEALQKQYPSVSYIYFLRASALYLLGQRDKAKLALEVALKDFPDNQEERRFYETLTGTKIKSDRAPSSKAQTGEQQ